MFEPEKVERDEMGYWLHSVFCTDEAVDKPITELPVSEGMEFYFISMEVDAPHLIPDFEEYDTRKWKPTKPQGKGWFLVGIYDTEDGPHACYAKAGQPPRTEGEEG